MRIRAGFVAAFICVALPARAQLVPNDAWRTIPTKHFRIHFTPPLEDLARRAAVNAERAYTELSGELVPPRGTIDLVVADNVDYVNGYATPFPSNRIVVYAHPPTDASGLRFYEDWNALVITHELTHIFHLDRTRGIWRIGQAIFGRNPLLFPGAYEPSWVTEGLAVYFESRLTGVGRLESSEHSMIARAAALEHALPTLQELSPSTSRFPGGEVVYVYGSLMFDYLSRTRGPGTIRAFVERGAKSIVPFFLTPTSRGAFGESFQTAWVKWRDSLTREMQARREVMPGWRQLTTSGRIALFPRWFGDTALVYSGDKGRELPAAYAVTLGAREQRLGRRNGISPNVRLSDGSILFSQAEFMGPYRVREDLYIERNGTETRLTYGARLTSPDARANGDIVAIQDVGGTTRVVRVSRDGRTISPLTASSLDTQYSDPRWSPDGTRIAAISQTRGTSQIVVLDPSGALITSFGATRGVNSTPSWSRDGTRVFFSSDRDGLPEIYMATLGAPLRIARLTDAPTGVFSPELSPAQTQLASVLFRADGYHIGVAPLSLQAKADEASDARTSPRVGCANCVAIPSGLAPLGTRDTTPAKKYSPWLSLVPRYWTPVLESSTIDGTTWGAATSGEDIVGRHNYTLEAAHNNRLAENSAWLWYRYAGFGLPLLDLYASQNYSNSPIEFVSPTDTTFGYFAERQRIASLQATFLRPRFRTYGLVSFGGEIENLSYATSPSTFFSALPAFYQQGRNYPALIASAGFSNASRPSLSISPEDGISVSVSGRQRWQTGTSGASTRSVVGVSSLYKSLDLPGFAHHVIALRGAGGWADARSPNLFHAGGVSGTSLEVFPGYAVGQQRRTFGVRGYPVSAESGIRSYSAAVEYRVPLFAPSRGFRFIPVFIDKASLTFFGESGRAYCPSASVGGGVCTATSTAPVENPVMTSAGAELNLDTSIQLDVPTRLRLGVAFPLANREILGAKSAAVYATFGASF